jgi:GNAT superfamily N-acetyltransferase
MYCNMEERGREKEKRKAGKCMDRETPHIDVRAVHTADAAALSALDYSFETDHIYTLRVQNRLMPNNDSDGDTGGVAFAFELIETPVDPPVYKDYRGSGGVLIDVEAELCQAEGGYVALADGVIAGGILLTVEEWRSVARIERILVGHQYRRYGVGSLLLSCADDWARKRGCWAVILETQNVNYPAIQFYLRNGFGIWSIQRHFYPPGPIAHEIAIFMGKRLTPPQV